MFGRERELEEAVAALEVARSGTPQVLLVGGDAGIGKTTLTAAAAEHARGLGFVVLAGHCLDIDDGVALRPVREALRQAVAGVPEDDLSPVTRRLAPYLRGEADSATVDELGFATSELAETTSVLLVIEDLHWADGATVDFATSVARTARGRLCLVLTYRAEEIGRKHRFRPALSELGRMAGVRRLDLRALDSEAVAGIVMARTGAEDLALTNALLARSEGNPLYVEELLAADSAEVPESLNDLLLARVDALSEDTRQLVRLASAQGSRLRPALLATTLEAGDDSVDDALREAIDGNVLRRVGEHLDFRHGLIREAVYDDLMPGERTRMHSRLAEVLESMTGESGGMAELSMLAFHWQAAHDIVRCYAVSLRAGLLAQDRQDFEGIAHLERALRLYDQVPHDEGEPTRAELLSLTSRLHGMHGARERSKQYMEQALALVDEDQRPLEAARIYVRYAGRTDEVPGRLTHKEAIDRALELVRDHPSEDLARALVVSGLWYMAQYQIQRSIIQLADAAQLADDLGLDATRASVTTFLAQDHLWLVQLSAAAALFQAAERMNLDLGFEERALQNRQALGLTMAFGLDPDRGRDILAEVRETARGRGWRATAAQAGFDSATALLLSGRLAEAEALLTDIIAEPEVPAPDYEALLPRVRLALLGGDVGRATELDRRWYEDMLSLAMLPNPDWVLLHIQVLLAAGVVDEVVSDCAGWLTCFAGSDNPAARAILAHGAYLAVEAGRAAGNPEADQLLRQTDEFLSVDVGDLAERGEHSFYGYSTPTTAALRAELDGEPSAERWRSAYDAAAQVGAGLSLPVRLRLAEALLAEGERDEARTLLPEIVGEAKAMGMNGVLEDAVKLARRHRIPVPGDDRPSKLDVLTAREREVLDVLTTGATNRAIAERLFISEKTVSVHVTNLLAKLGAANRTEAAALARELAPAD